MFDQIYIPRESIALLHALGKENQNPSICVRIPYREHVISIALDSSHGPGNLSRGDIRIYWQPTDADVTEQVLKHGNFHYDQTMIYGTADELQVVFRVLDRFAETGYYRVQE